MYEPMMELLTRPKKSFKKHYKMFTPFVIGWALGFLFLAKGIEVLFELSPVVALMLFFGLICGTIPELFKMSENSDIEHKKSWTPFVVTLSLAYLFFQVLESMSAASIAPSFLSYLFSGGLWGLSMIIPGLTSSTILIFLGLFEPLTAGVAALDMSVLVPFLIGIVATVLIFARLVTMLFEKHYTAMSRVILGFVIASSIKILPTDFGTPLTFAISFVCFAGGFIVARAMDCSKHNPDKK